MTNNLKMHLDSLLSEIDAEELIDVFVCLRDEPHQKRAFDEIIDILSVLAYQDNEDEEDEE